MSCSLRAVVLCQIRRNILGVGVADWSAERLDHFRDLCVPSGRVEKRRIHLDVSEAVAGATVSLDLVEPRSRLELNQRLIRGGGKGNKRGEYGECNDAHGHLPQPALSVMLCITLS